MDSGVDDRVNVHNIFKGPHGGGGDGGMGLAAIAGLMGRGGHEGGLASALPLLLAGHHRGQEGVLGGGLGAGLLGGVLGGLLFNRRGLGGGDCGSSGDGGGSPCSVALTLANKLGTIEAAIPISAGNTQAAIGAVGANLTATTLQQTIALQGDLAAQTLGIQQGLSNVKDTVQAVNLGLATALGVLNQNVLTQGCETRAAVRDDGDKTRAMLVARAQLEDATKISMQAAENAELRNELRRNSEHAETKLQITNTNTAVAAQTQRAELQQQQQQYQTIANALQTVMCEVAHTKQIAQATNQNIIAGNTGAVTTGAQAANPTNVNTH